LRIRPLLACATAAGFALTLGLAAPALASSSLGHPAIAPSDLLGATTPAISRSAIPTVKSTNLAGYVLAADNGNVAVTTQFVVPTVRGCTKATRAIVPMAGTNATVSSTETVSIAGMFVGCSNGKASYFPSFIVNGSFHNFPSLAAHAGDTVVVKTVEGPKGTVVSVVDKTHKNVNKTLKGAAAQQIDSPAVGAFGWFTSNTSPPVGVPQFGKVSFSASKVLGHPFTAYTPFLERSDRYNSKVTTLQIKAGPLGPDGESFTTVFEHS
jgi:hypothetical protein